MVKLKSDTVDGEKPGKGCIKPCTKKDTDGSRISVRNQLELKDGKVCPGLERFLQQVLW